MADNFIQKGDCLDWTNGGTAVSSGDVVVIGSNGDALLAVALVDIANGATGSVALEGVFSVPKVSAAVIGQGEYVMYDKSLVAFDDNAATAAAGDVSDAVTAWESAGAGVTTIKVRFDGKAGVLA